MLRERKIKAKEIGSFWGTWEPFGIGLALLFIDQKGYSPAIFSRTNENLAIPPSFLEDEALAFDLTAAVSVIGSS